MRFCVAFQALSATIEGRAPVVDARPSHALPALPLRIAALSAPGCANDLDADRRQPAWRGVLLVLDHPRLSAAGRLGVFLHLQAEGFSRWQGVAGRALSPADTAAGAASPGGETADHGQSAGAGGASGGSS